MNTHYPSWLGVTVGCVFVLSLRADAYVMLTFNPLVETGEDVKMTCSFSDPSADFIVSIRKYATGHIIWQYSSTRSTAVGEQYEGRIQHTPQYSYKRVIAITLTDVSRTDDGWYTCTLETNQQAPIGSKYLTVHAPPHSLRVFVTSPPPYKESQGSIHYPYFTPTYTVNCTFSAYPSYYDVRPTAIIRGGERKEVDYSILENGNMYNCTLSAQFPLTKEDNGKKNIRCEVTWKGGTNREKIISAQLESPPNVVFKIPGLSSDGLPRATFTQGETISATCRTESANPPQHINWFIKHHIREGIEVTYEPGEYNGQKTVSTLRVTAERWMDGREVTCCHSVDIDVCQRTRIEVTTSSTTVVVTTTSTTTETVRSKETSPISTTTPFQPDSTPTSITRETATPPQSTSITRTTTTGRMSDKITEAERNTTGSYNPNQQTGKPEPDQTLIIGIAVGVGGAVVIIAVILAVVLVRRRKGKGTGGKGLQEADKDQEKRLSMNMYDEIDESKVGTNGTKTDRPGVVYEEIKKTSFKTTSLQQRPGYDKLNGEVKNPTTSERTSNHIPVNDPLDTGELYAVVNKPPKPGLENGRRQSTSSNASSEPDIGPAIQERRKSLEINAAVADTKASDDLEESLHGATQVEQGRNSVSKDNKKSEVAPVLKPVMKSKPNKPTKPEKPTVTPLKPKVDKANKPRQGLATSDESQSVYYNTREEMIHEGTPKINPTSDKSKDNKKNMKKPEDNRTEYYNTHDGVRKSTGSSNAGLDDPYCEIPTENTNNNVEDGAPEYAEIGNTQDKRPPRSTAPLDGSSYHTVDFSQEQDDSDSADGSDSDSD